jgi:type 1 fimbria pilin
MNNEHVFKKCAGMLLALSLCSSVYASQSSGVVNGVAGNVGKLHVHGSLTESTCSIEMDSLDQSINVGNVATAEFQNIGDRATPAAFQIRLKDCMSDSTEMVDFKTGLTTWSTTQPGVKVRFLAESDVLNPNIVRVNGTKGLGLEITDLNGESVDLGQLSRPILIPTQQSILTYYVTPVKTASLEPNAFSAIISFELVYE